MASPVNLRVFLLPIAVGLGSVVAPNVARGATYWVSTSGNDGGSGAMGDPWATLQHAADTVAAGDTVIVLPGDYVGFYLETSGTMAERITFSAMGGVMIVADNGVTPDGINLEGASYVTLEGFWVVGATRAGIRAVQGEFVVLRDNILEDNGRWGILTGFCNDLLIEGNEASGSIDEHGIYVSNSADRPVVRRNRMWGNYANGLHMNGDASLGGDGVIEDALVEENVIYGNGEGGGSGINCDGCQRALIRNNEVTALASGISLYAIDAAMGSHDNVIVNNTVVVTATGRWAVNIQDASTGNVVHNNILLSEHATRGAIDISADSLPGFASDGNAVIDRFTVDGGSSVLTLAQWQAQTGQDAGSVVIATPLDAFGDPGVFDYHLLPGAAAIDVGLPTHAPPADIDGVLRPQGAAIDAGAHEFCPGGCDPGGSGSGGSGGSGGSAGGTGASGSASSGSSGAATDGGGGTGSTASSSGTGASSASSAATDGGSETAGSASTGGCGCAVTPPIGHGLLAALVVPLASRRRRRRDISEVRIPPRDSAGRR
jgi:parallel beta-helix repeat protein